MSGSRHGRRLLRSHGDERRIHDVQRAVIHIVLAVVFDHESDIVSGGRFFAASPDRPPIARDDDAFALIQIVRPIDLLEELVLVLGEHPE